ncbi:hypothetical protein MMC17_001628 [Xylographa soralifera]|nr:hypothetical protein [Xylographa soralifera]
MTQQILPLRQHSRPAEDLWTKAFNKLHPEDQAPVNQTLTSRVVVLKDILNKIQEKKQQCLQKRWTYKNEKGETVILRDVFDKITVWIDKFKAVGDMVVQYDTAHAALPWAAVRLVLQASVNDSQTFGAMAEGIELVSNLITRYTIVECLYLRKPSMAKSQLTQALLEVYSAVLVYLSKAKRFYERSTPGRIAISVIHTPEQSVTQYLIKIIQKQTNVDACTHLVAQEFLNTGIMTIDTAQEKLKGILRDLDSPIREMADQLSDLSSVIESFKKANLFVATPAPVAYFYCARDAAEPERALPDEIMRTILEQLSLDPCLPIRDSVVRAYETKKREARGRNPEKLSLDETVDVILALLETNPATIIIDALDECHAERRQDLLLAMQKIIRRSQNLVKFFVSSRDDHDIVYRLSESPNLYISVHNNSADIERFVHFQVSKAIEEERILCGKVSSTLKDHVIQTLNTKAEGMFRLVSLHIQSLCDPQQIKTEQNVYYALTKLPKKLNESYNVIYNQICDSHYSNAEIATRTLKWLLCARRPMKSFELIAAVSVNSAGYASALSPSDILSVCCNFVVLDLEQDVFRFAHLSVREYLESRSEYGLFETQSLAFERCLDVYMITPVSNEREELTILQNKILKPYAELYWAVHYRNIEKSYLIGSLPEKLSQFLYCDSTAGPGFTEWLSDGESRWLDPGVTYTVREPLEQKLRASLNDSKPPLFLGCTIGLVSILEGMRGRTGVAWHLQNKVGQSALHLAAAYGHDGIVKMLLEEGVGVTLKDLQGRTALHWAALRGHGTAVRLLLDHGAAIAAMTHEGSTALHFAATFGHETVVHILLEKGAGVTAKSQDKRTALHQAARHGHKKVMLLLLNSGASAMAKDKDGSTALHVATHRISNATIVQLLIEHGADLAARNNSGSTALHEAATRGYQAIVGVLLQAGSDHFMKNNHGETPLHLATTKAGNAKVVQLLLRYRADVSATDHHGQTALHTAVRYRHHTIIQILLASGIDVTAQTLDGKSALQYAIDVRHDEIFRLLFHHCLNHGLTMSGEVWDTATDYMDHLISSIFCDGCDRVIPDSKTHWHCYMCNNGDYDLCQLCIDKNIKCGGPDHHLVQRAFTAQRAHCSECTRVTTDVEPSYCCKVGSDAQIPQVFCNVCEVSIPELEVFSHCEQCSDSDEASFDLCKSCMDSSMQCNESSHILSRRYFTKEVISLKKRYMFIMDERVNWHSDRLIELPPEYLKECDFAPTNEYLDT